MDRSAPRTATPPAPPQRPARILVAEDDESAASLLHALLSRVGYEVSLASNGAEALRMLEAGPLPDVLLLDWMLPEASGLEICRRVRERCDPLMLPILMVTAKTDAESIAEAFTAGASDYLTKPFLGAELRARIAAHLRIKLMVEERARIDVGRVLRDTLDLRERQLHSWGLRTQVDISPSLPTVFGDPHQLQQVFLNIVINAEQALRDSGETLHISAGLAVPSTRRPDGTSWVALTFYNDGPPIPPEVLPRIFQPFFTTKNEDEGTGLGLSICPRVVREHGGEMDVESGPDGTTFRIFLPANGSSALTAAPARS